jgi:hypothetical protein
MDLPGDLYWEDELEWSSYGMVSEVSCRGNPIYQYGQLQAGRPITLVSPDRNRGFFSRKNVTDLQGLAEQGAQEFTLTLSDGRSFTVIFDLERSPPYEFEPLMFLEHPDESQHYTGKLYFREV